MCFFREQFFKKTFGNVFFEGANREMYFFKKSFEMYFLREQISRSLEGNIFENILKNV